MNIIKLSGTTISLGTMVLTSDTEYNGYLEKIVMEYDDAATGADITITAEGLVSEPLLTVTNAGVADLTWYPRTLANKIADASAFTDVAEKIFITASTFKCSVAQGGDEKNVVLYVVLSDE